MLTLQGTRATRFELVTVAHRLVLAVLPLRLPESCDAISRFCSALSASRLPSPDREAVVLRLFSALEPQNVGHLPSLSDRFLRMRIEEPDIASRVQRCFDELIRFRGVSHPAVRQAVALIVDEYWRPDLSERRVAETVGLTPSALSAVFKLHTGARFGDYVRELRLDHAAKSLTTSRCSVKEAWAAAGYGDAANFYHHFRQRFGVPPRKYRTLFAVSRLRPPGSLHLPVEVREVLVSERGRRHVLIVEDDTETRKLLRTEFNVSGYSVDDCSTGHDALKIVEGRVPDVIVLDFHLPDMDGFEYLRALRRRRASLLPPVVVLTADWELEDEAALARSLGATIVPKTTQLIDIKTTLASLCAVTTIPMVMRGS